jgi:Protein of unknown function (DUF3108)
MNDRPCEVEDCPLVTPFRTILPRPAAYALRLLGGFGAIMLALLVPQHQAAAQGRLDARYEATLAGIPVGQGSWTIEVQDDQFSAAASGGTAGILKTFSAASGTSASQGRVVNGALVANSYAGTTNMWKKSEAIHMTLVNGYVKEFSIDPQPPVDPARLPVTDAQHHGVFDPMTGVLLHVSGTGELLSPDTCHNSAAFFDGRMRYELRLDYKRMTAVKARAGYQGPAVVCAVTFVPVSGYIPDRPVIKYLAAQRDMEVTFVPLAGTRILVPYRMVVPTPLGTAMLEATRFVTQATPRVAKTQ